MTAWASTDDIEHMAYCLGEQRPEIARWVDRARQNPRVREFARRRLQLLCRREDIDLSNVWLPHPQPEQLGTAGLILGRVRYGLLYWLLGEWPYSGLFAGAPGFGKTTLICLLLMQLAEQGYGAVVADLRGDYEWLSMAVPSAVLIPWEQNKDNLLAPLDSNASLKHFYSFWATFFAEVFGLQEASTAFLTQHLIALGERCRTQGRYPDLLDLRTHLEQLHIVSKDVKGYRDRTLDKLRMIIDTCGEQFVGVQRGYDLGRLLQDGRIVVVRIDTGKSLADFYTGLLIFRIYMSRLHSEQRFDHRPVFIVLDEQRSILHQRSKLVDRVWEIDRGITLARALRICFLIAEQCVSDLSHAVKVSTRLKVSFNTGGPEQDTTARMMALDPAQRQALHELAPGRAVATIGGDRIPTPTLIEVPQLHEIQALANQS